MNNKPLSRFVCGVLLASQLSLCYAFDFDGEKVYSTDQKAAQPKTESSEISTEADYYVVELINHTPVNAGVRSLLVPGWGQGFNGEKRKGALLFGTAVAAGTLSVLFFQNASESYDDYKGSGLSNNSNYDDYKRDLTLSWIFGGTLAVIWGYSIFDAIQKGYSPAVGQTSDIQLSLNSTGADVRWRRKF